MSQVVNVSEIVLTGDNRGALAALKGVTDKGKQMEGDFNNISGNMDVTLGKIGTAIAGLGTAAVAGFGALIKNAIDAADRFDEMSQRVGIAVESLSAFDYAAKMSGVSTELLESSLKKFNMALFDARTEGSEANKILSQLGVGIQDANGDFRDAESILLDVADRFTLVKDPVDRAEVAIKLFGKAGADMVPFLALGRDGIEDMRTEAEKLGIVLSTETAEQAGQFNDAVDRMSLSFQGLAYKVLPDVLDTMTSLIGKIETLATKSKPLFDFIKEATKFYTGQSGVVNTGLFSNTLDPNFAPGTSVIPAFGGNPVTGTTLQTNGITINAGTAGGRSGSTNRGPRPENAPAGLAGMLFSGLGVSAEQAFKAAEEENNFIKEREQYIHERRMAKYNAEKEAEEQRTAMEREQARIREQIAREELEFKLQSSQELLAANANLFDALFEISGSRHRALFDISKAFALGEATLNTYKAVSGALAMQPWTPFNYVLAAGALANGLANVARISATQPGSRPGGSVSAPPPPAGLMNPDNQNTSTSGSGRSVIVNVTISGSAYNLAALGRDLVPEIRKALGDGKR